jgi:hypothetical protein
MKSNFIIKPSCLLHFALVILTLSILSGCRKQSSDLRSGFLNPPESAQPWVFWYWMYASVSREGITADLEAMKQAGIGGAYLMSIKGVTDPPLYEPPVEQLSPLWWEMVRHAMNEADRLGLKLAMHSSDGFALAGGPWITPELSMQKVVWKEIHIKGGRLFDDTLPKPQSYAGYYRDIAILGFPMTKGADISTVTVTPRITISRSCADARFLVKENNEKVFRSEESCWIQYEFDRSFTCRSIKIRTNGNNYQANRLIIKTSEDGDTFRTVGRLEPPRHGWQDSDADVTHVIPATTAKYFRFVYDKEGSEPGAEDLDAAKWKPVLKVCSIELSSAPRLHHYEGKTGAVWRISPRTTSGQVPDEICVPVDKIIDITKHMDSNGRLVWNVPEGRWTILRIGHTSTGHTNTTGGAGRGLECDKFNPEAVKLQFNNWFGEAVRVAGPELAGRVLRILHTDSWECGSQNWSPVFREEFSKRRGYDLLPYIPAMTGVPVQSADISERFLHDIRRTIAELVVDNFFGTMAELTHANGCIFSAECVAPTMTSDGMLHYKNADIPMGEFWFRSPTHDKPNDILDAISGAHIYGKPVIQAEAFTQLRMAWDEHPAMLKTVADRNYALGINGLVFHVFTHNPWLNRKPGMTLDGVGLYFQRDQTWWGSGRAWIDYVQRCQVLLQYGRPVADIAVFTGEETPRRAVLPDRLVSSLPGIFDNEIIESEKQRLANKGVPLREIPDGVKHSANMADPEDWLDPLRGYKYDSFNRDALLRYARVRNGRIELPGGANYGLLVIPGKRNLSPNSDLMTAEVAVKLLELVKAGATIIINERPVRSPSLNNYPDCDEILNRVIDELWAGELSGAGNASSDSLLMWRVGKGRVVKGPFYGSSFETLGIEPDFKATDLSGTCAGDIAWNHRTAPGADIYFISNQRNIKRTVNISLRVSGRLPEIYNPLTGETGCAKSWQIKNGRTELTVQLFPGGSVFIVLSKTVRGKSADKGKNWAEYSTVKSLNGVWQVKFDSNSGGPEDTIVFRELTDWSKHPDPGIRYYSGTATYLNAFNWSHTCNEQSRIWLDLGQVANIAEVSVNDIYCGVAWTYPYRVEITKAINTGKNILEIEVTNTWANRLAGDRKIPEYKKVTWTTAPYRIKDEPLLESGLLGPVSLIRGIK